MAVNLIQNEEIERALHRLRDVLKNTAENNRLCIAYSGGLDSRFLAFLLPNAGWKLSCFTRLPDTCRPRSLRTPSIGRRPWA